MKSPKQTNPALRLRSIMQGAANIPVQSNNRQHNYRQAWCMVFDVDENTADGGTAEVVEYLIELRKLFGDVIDIFQDIEGLNQELFVQPVFEMSRIVKDLRVLEATWGQYLTYVSAEKMVALDYIAEYSKSLTALSETDIPADELQKISEDADALYKEIIGSNLPRGVRRILLDIVERLRHAVHIYRVHGGKALKDALGDATGILFANKEIVEENKDSEQLLAVANLMKRVDTAYQVAMKVKSILEVATTALPLLGTGK